MNSPKAGSTLNRRSFFKSTAIGAAALAIPGFTLLDGAESVFAGTKPTLNSSDVAVLTFLAAAELVEADLWGQYSELATNNPEFRRALQEIDNSMPDYVTGDFDDETSHAAFINAFLIAASQDANVQFVDSAQSRELRLIREPTSASGPRLTSTTRPA